MHNLLFLHTFNMKQTNKHKKKEKIDQNNSEICQNLIYKMNLQKPSKRKYDLICFQKRNKFFQYHQIIIINFKSIKINRNGQTDWITLSGGRKDDENHLFIENGI